jgi:hypothetical protein
MSKLSSIAASMRSTIADKPAAWVSQPLPGGLEIVLSHREESWRLALRRLDVYPSDTEVEVCSRVFGVPEGTEPARHRSNDRSNDRIAHYHIVELNWREIELPCAATL